MSDPLSIKVDNDHIQQSAAVSSTVDAGKVLANGNGGSNYIAPVEEEPAEDIDKVNAAKRKEFIEKAVNEVIKGTGLTLEEAIQMLKALNKDDEAIQMLKAMNKDNKDFKKQLFQKVLNCLKYAIEDCTDSNGKLDKEKLRNTFGCYVLLTTKPEKPMTCDQARAMMNMSLLQIIQAQNPKLKGKVILTEDAKRNMTEAEIKEKGITAEEIADTIKSLIQTQFSKEKLNEFKNRPDEVKEYIRSLFGTALSKCTQNEMNLLTEAFIKVLKDNNLQDGVHVIVESVCENLKEKPEELTKFINTTLVEILKKYNFSEDAINKICTSALGATLAKNPELFETLIQGGIDFIKSLSNNPEELKILLKVLDAHLNDQLDSLSDEELAVLNKYKDQVAGLIQIYAQIAMKPELADKFRKKLNELNGLVQETGLGNYIYNSLQILYENNPDLFTNCQSKDDFAKILNQVTDNKYSEATGDSNPDNLYQGGVDSTGYGTEYALNNNYGYTTTSQAVYEDALNNVSNLSGQLYSEDSEAEFTVDPLKGVTKQSAAANGKYFEEAWAQKIIDINFLGKNFQRVCTQAANKVKNFLDIHKQDRINYLRDWHNSELSGESARRYSMNADEIDDLGLSISDENILKNRYKQLHRNDADKTELA